MQSLTAAISLQRIRANAKAVLRAAGVPLIAVVKDDAYGHGAEQVAHALTDLCAAFAVSSVEEGAALRLAGITKDVLVLTPPLSGYEAIRLARYGLIATVASLHTLRIVASAAPVRAHLAVNTGMNRYGLRPAALRRACREAKECGIMIEGTYSHFYDPADEGARTEQLRLFLEACGVVREFFPSCVRHISATGGAVAGIGADAVRCGLALYGYLPAGFEGRLPVLPAARLYATVASCVKQFGGGAGYAAAERDFGTLHTLRAGYGDGLFRAGMEGAVGKLCMDASICAGRARVGTRRRIVRDAEEYARRHDTTVYEVLVRLMQKAEKKYV